MMFTNTPAVTVWEKTTVNRAAAYIRHQTGAAYWEDTRGETVNDIARNPDGKVLIILHKSQIGNYIPQPDDRILRGVCSDADPPKHALTVTAVKDFLYGSDAVQHIEITAK